MGKSAVDNVSTIGFVIDILSGTWNWLTKNLFIDRDINDIKDPKNDKPNNIFKIFQLCKNSDVSSKRDLPDKIYPVNSTQKWKTCEKSFPKRKLSPGKL